MIEIPLHPFFIATQAHPELKSRPNRPHPLFLGFVNAAIEKGKQVAQNKQSTLIIYKKDGTKEKEISY